jgi:hypothetical protein
LLGTLARRRRSDGSALHRLSPDVGRTASALPICGSFDPAGAARIRRDHIIVVGVVYGWHAYRQSKQLFRPSHGHRTCIPRCARCRHRAGTDRRPGYLDGPDLKTAAFTVVGYGTDAFITGSAFAPKAITVFDGVRSYRQVAVPAQDAFPTGS